MRDDSALTKKAHSDVVAVGPGGSRVPPRYQADLASSASREKTPCAPGCSVSSRTQSARGARWPSASCRTSATSSPWRKRVSRISSGPNNREPLVGPLTLAGNPLPAPGHGHPHLLPVARPLSEPTRVVVASGSRLFPLWEGLLVPFVSTARSARTWSARCGQTPSVVLAVFVPRPGIGKPCVLQVGRSRGRYVHPQLPFLNAPSLTLYGAIP